VKQSGGFVWVYSEPGHGTTFKVYLPKSEASANAKASGLSPKTQNSLESILLVEDDEKVRQVAARVLRSKGYRVIEASNGPDALKVCEAEQDDLDLVVTDIVMPGMKGTEFAELLRARKPDARILFTSGYTEDAAFRQNLLRDGEAFLEKPFTPDALAKKARQLLGSADS
jgi:CheY-like chemotaxis protein